MTHRPSYDRRPAWLLAVLLLGQAGWCVAAGAAIPFESAAVETQVDGSYTVVWHAPDVGTVTVYAGLDADHVGRARRVGEGGDDATLVAKLPDAARWYFELVPARGDPLVVADRSLHLAGAANFRDVGGYRTEDGKWVRMGLAYRSNELDGLTPEALATLAQLHLRLICDLRTDEERQRAPDLVPAGVEDIPADVLADDAPQIHAMMSRPPGATSPADRAARLLELYRDFVRTGSAQRAYHLLFERLADPAALPTVFHCTVGKDRTGWADAVLLTILHVPHATIVADYELTNRYLGEAAPGTIQASLQSSQPRHAMSADPADLEAAFAEVSERYGSFEAYLHQGLGLDDAALEHIRKNFLAD